MKLKIILALSVIAMNTIQAEYRYNVKIQDNDFIIFSLKDGQNPGSENSLPAPDANLPNGCVGEANKDYIQYYYINDRIYYKVVENSVLIYSVSYNKNDIYDPYIDLKGYRYSLSSFLYQENETIYYGYCRSKL